MNDTTVRVAFFSIFNVPVTRGGLQWSNGGPQPFNMRSRAIIFQAFIIGQLSKIRFIFISRRSKIDIHRRPMFFGLARITNHHNEWSCNYCGLFTLFPTIFFERGIQCSDLVIDNLLQTLNWQAVRQLSRGEMFRVLDSANALEIVVCFTYCCTSWDSWLNFHWNLIDTGKINGGGKNWWLKIALLMIVQWKKQNSVVNVSKYETLWCLPRC